MEGIKSSHKDFAVVSLRNNNNISHKPREISQIWWYSIQKSESDNLLHQQRQERIVRMSGSNIFMREMTT